MSVPDNPRLAVAILAAGSSQRFGDQDKLAIDLRGKLLGHHASDTLSHMTDVERCVIASDPDHACAPHWRDGGFDVRINRDAASGMGSSVAVAAAFAIEREAHMLLIALADMPFVPLAHFEALRNQAHASGPRAIVASSAWSVPMPPAIFGSENFPNILKTRGNTGARSLLAQGSLLQCPAEWLIDVDTQETYRNLR